MTAVTKNKKGDEIQNFERGSPKDYLSKAWIQLAQ
jgi:hypothetical protein